MYQPYWRTIKHRQTVCWASSLPHSFAHTAQCHLPASSSLTHIHVLITQMRCHHPSTLPPNTLPLAECLDSLLIIKNQIFLSSRVLGSWWQTGGGFADTERRWASLKLTQHGKYVRERGKVRTTMERNLFIQRIVYLNRAGTCRVKQSRMYQPYWRTIKYRQTVCWASDAVPRVAVRNQSLTAHSLSPSVWLCFANFTLLYLYYIWCFWLKCIWHCLLYYVYCF